MEVFGRLRLLPWQWSLPRIFAYSRSSGPRNCFFSATKWENMDMDMLMLVAGCVSHKGEEV